MSILARPDADPRIVEALPWLAREYQSRLDFEWLVRHAKQMNLQNRLGFVLQAADLTVPEGKRAIDELARARLLQEDTLCWDSMPASTREWMRANRTRLARYWNVLTRHENERITDGG